MLFLSGTMSVWAQQDYPNGNAAYNNEALQGFRDVSINGGSMVYSYDTQSGQYRCEGEVLLPDLVAETDGHHMALDDLCGFDGNVSASSDAFQWDDEIIISPESVFDRGNLFVSPVSVTQMNYGTAMQHNLPGFCSSTDCLVEIDTPDSSLVYAEHMPLSGTYNCGTGEDLVNAGDLKGTGTDMKVSQQQLDSTSNCGYCAKTYGPGWRLPNDLEVGHSDDEEGTGHGFDIAYQGNSSGYIWTSSLFKVYAVKRWVVGLQDGLWENCAGFISAQNYVRCVFEGLHEAGGATRISRQNISEAKVYPNPVGDRMHIRVPNTENLKAIKMYDILGNPVISYKTDGDKKQFTLRTTRLPNGIYFLQLISQNNTVHSRKIIKN